MESGDTTEDKMITEWKHEHDMARLEIANKRLWILVIIIFLALVLTNGAWLYYESQWEVVEKTTETVTQSVEASGNSDAVMAGIGDAFNGGESKTDSKEDYTAVSQKEEKVNE